MRFVWFALFTERFDFSDLGFGFGFNFESKLIIPTSHTNNMSFLSFCFHFIHFFWLRSLNFTIKYWVVMCVYYIGRYMYIVCYFNWNMTQNTPHLRIYTMHAMGRANERWLARVHAHTHIFRWTPPTLFIQWYMCKRMDFKQQQQEQPSQQEG